MKQAVKNSEADLVEKAMLEDKIRATGTFKQSHLFVYIESAVCLPSQFVVDLK